MGDINPMIVKRAFSNGTEGDAWQRVWCEYCAHDHGLHHGNADQPMCELIGAAIFHQADEPLNVEAWIAEPDDGRFFLPSRMICLRFTPCHGPGCNGDPGATDRAQRVAEVQAYWRDRVRP